MGRFLLVRSKGVCYESFYTFTDCLYHALRRYGADVDVYDESKSANIRLFLGKSYDAIIDFDSEMPDKKLDDGTSVVNALDGPFINYLLDHPLYFHGQLSQNVSQHVICIDRRHVSYLEKYYPELKSITFAPLPMMPVNEDDIKRIEDRRIGILFTGTYTSSEFVQRKLSKINPDARRDVFEILSYMQADTNLSIEDAMQKFLDTRDKKIPDKMFRQFLQYYYLADTAAAAWARDMVIRTLLNTGMKITVCGHGWNDLKRYDNTPFDNLEILPEVNYHKSLDMAYDAKILLNVMPWFKDGVHDRVFTAAGHGAVCLSDRTPALDEIMRDSYVGYDLERLEDLPDKVKRVLGDSTLSQQLSDTAHRNVYENYSWDQFAASLCNSYLGSITV